MVPDKNGNFANVIQGHDSIDNLLNSPEPFLSTLVGRYGNRICKGKFTIDGKEYNLAINNGPNHLHGGAFACNAGNPGSIPGPRRSPGEGNGNPLQHSCLENPMDGGA